MHPITSARYLGVIVDENVNWKKHLNDTSHKLMRGNVILSKIRNYVNKATLRTFYFATSTPTLIMSLLHQGILITRNREYLFSRKKL